MSSQSPIVLHVKITKFCPPRCVFFHVSSLAECYSEASDHEETESSEIPPPPYSEETLQDSDEVTGPPGSTHQVGHAFKIKQLISFQMYLLHETLFGSMLDLLGSIVCRCLSGYPSPALLHHAPRRRQRLAFLARQHDDVAELVLFARQTPAVLAGPGLAGLPACWRNGSCLLRPGTFASTSARTDGRGGFPVIISGELDNSGLP